MSKTKADKQWLDDVSSLCCIACRNAGLGASLAEIHHVRSGAGMAQRAAHNRVLPLCPFVKGWIGHHPDYADLVYGAPASTARD